MFTVNVEENVRRWHRLTRHLQANSYDSRLCFRNPLSLVKTFSLNGCPDELILLCFDACDASTDKSEPQTFAGIVRSCCDVADDELVLSPWLLYNRCGRNALSSEVTLHFDKAMLTSPQISESVEVADAVFFYILRSTSYSIDVDLSCSVRAYFFEHRLYLDAKLSTGDVLPIPLTELDQRRHLSACGSHPDHILLKVGRIQTAGNARLCYIDSRSTRVELAGVHRDFVPNFAFSPLLDDEPIDCLDDHFERACRAVSHTLTSWKAPSKVAYGLLLSGKPGLGQDYLLWRLARRFALNLAAVHPHDVASASLVSSSTALRAVFTTLAPPKAPCLLLLRDLPRLVRSRDSGTQADPELLDAVVGQWHAIKEASPDLPVILCATEADPEGNSDGDDECDALPARLLRLFIERLAFALPDRDQREATLRRLSDRRFVPLQTPLLAYLAQRSAGFAFAHFGLLVDKLGAAGSALSFEACDAVLEEVFKLTGRRFRPADIPNVAWHDVGGLEEVIDEIVSAVQLTSGGIGAGGVLLYGPPGTGKTLLAKAVAKECNLNFLSVKGPELLNMYVGQSEANIRDLFRRAREAAPCVVFCDELDSLAPRRGRAGDSGGVMDRVVSQLLAEMEASTERAPLQVIGATNRPDLLDPALLRPGRFDRLIYVGASHSPATHAAILRAQTRRFPVEHGAAALDLDAVARALPRYVTGADVYAVCSEAWRTAVSRFIEDGDGSQRSREFFVRQEDFLKAAKHLVPSVSEVELARYETLRQKFSRASVPEEYEAS